MDEPRRSVPVHPGVDRQRDRRDLAFIWVGAIVEVLLLATIVRLAWRWRAEEVKGDLAR